MVGPLEKVIDISCLFENLSFFFLSFCFPSYFFISIYLLNCRSKTKGEGHPGEW
jgi:hypothetical protein